VPEINCRGKLSFGLLIFLSKLMQIQTKLLSLMYIDQNLKKAEKENKRNWKNAKFDKKLNLKSKISKKYTS
jgi:hypothetical protein